MALKMVCKIDTERVIQFWPPITASRRSWGPLGGPWGLAIEIRLGLLNVRFAFPSKLSFFTPTCLEIVPKWGLLGVSGSLYVHKNG